MCVSASAAADGYRRREPENTALYQVVDAYLAEALAQAAERSEHGFGYPGFVEDTFRRYLQCGLLGYGFCRIHCDDCGFDRLLAFSCKARGLCPSCNTRRMHDTAAHLADRVLPHVAYRQWVMSFPKYSRFRLARDPELISRVLRGILQVISAWYRRTARATGVKDGQCGAVTFVQRFGCRWLSKSAGIWRIPREAARIRHRHAPHSGWGEIPDIHAAISSVGLTVDATWSKKLAAGDQPS